MSITLSALQQQRRDTAANWTSANPTLLAAEWGYETDTGKWKVGDGSTAWTSLAYVGIADASGNLPGNITIAGNLTVEGTTTTIESTTVTIEDKNIELAKVTTPTDTTADGGGFTIKGATDKTFNWVNSTDCFTSSERLDLPAGTESLPALIFNGETDSGIYKPAADKLGFCTAGDEKLIIDSSGFIGIGTSSPQTLLTLRGSTPRLTFEPTADTQNCRIQFAKTDGTVQSVIASGGANGPTMQFSDLVASTERMRISSTGNIGIGTTSPSSLLHLQTTSAEIIQTFTTSTGTVKLYANNDDLIIDADQHRFRSENGATEYVRINNSGNVGIGTTVPDVELHIREDAPKLRLESSSSLDDTAGTEEIGRIEWEGFKNTNSTVAASIRVRQDGTWSTHQQWFAPSAIEFFTQDQSGSEITTPRLTINRLGDVGIGTADPSSPLQIDGGLFSANTTTVDKTLLLSSGLGPAGTGVQGASIAFNRIASSAGNEPRAAIAIKEYSSNFEQCGLTFYTHPTSTGTDAMVEQMCINHEGSVGIGTASPSSILHLQNDNVLDIRIERTGSFPSVCRIANEGNLLNIEQNVNGIRFLTGTSLSEAMRIDDNGDVGIGTTAPSFPLDIRTAAGTDTVLRLLNSGTGSSDDTILRSQISGTTASNYVYFGDADDNDAGRVRYSHSTNSLSIRTNGQEALVIDGSQRVGIGVTSPSNMLHVASSNSTAEVVAGFGNANISPGLEINTNGNLEWGFNAKNSRHLTFDTNQTEGMRLDSSQRLLIGTASTIPADGNLGFSNLQVAGLGGTFTRFSANTNAPVLTLSKSRSDTTGTVAILQSNDAVGQIEFTGADGTNFVTAARIKAFVDGTPGTADMPGRLTFSTTPDGSITTQERMTIKNNGAVGIGTNAPDERLHVVVVDAASSGTTSIAKFTKSVSGTERGLEILGADQTALGVGFKASGTASPFVIQNKDGAEKFRVTSTGAVGFSGANYGSSGQVLTSTGGSTAPTWQTPGAFTTAGGILETLAGMCDGRSVTVQSGTYTMPTYTCGQNTTASYADLSGSVISYTPPSGTNQVIYEFQYQASFFATNRPLFHTRFYYDGTEVTAARFSKYAGYDGNVNFRFVFSLNNATADIANGKLGTWNTAKAMKLMIREYASGYRVELHETHYFDGVGSAQCVIPSLTITSIA